MEFNVADEKKDAPKAFVKWSVVQGILAQANTGGVLSTVYVLSASPSGANPPPARARENGLRPARAVSFSSVAAARAV
jgi:hypothetical protein